MSSDFFNKTGNNTGNAGTIWGGEASTSEQTALIFQNRNMQIFRPLQKEVIDSTVVLSNVQEN